MEAIVRHGIPMDVWTNRPCPKGHKGKKEKPQQGYGPRRGTTVLGRYFICLLCPRHCQTELF